MWVGGADEGHSTSSSCVDGVCATDEYNIHVYTCTASGTARSSTARLNSISSREYRETVGIRRCLVLLRFLPTAAWHA